MTETRQKTLAELLSPARVAEIDRWIAKYPHDQKQSAVMAALRIAQEETGYLLQSVMDAIAVYLEMPAIAVYEVATFYSMYKLRPGGQHEINVCTNISCKLKGSDAIVNALESHLGISLGDTTEDGRFTLKAVECLGACVHAPVMQVDKDYYECLHSENLSNILRTYEK